MGAGRPQPCEVCRRVHQGRCAPDDERSVDITVSLPGYLHRDLVEFVPWGERSAFVATALDFALDELRDRREMARLEALHAEAAAEHAALPAGLLPQTTRLYAPERFEQLGVLGDEWRR